MIPIWPKASLDVAPAPGFILNQATGERFPILCYYVTAESQLNGIIHKTAPELVFDSDDSEAMIKAKKEAVEALRKHMVLVELAYMREAADLLENSTSEQNEEST